MKKLVLAFLFISNIIDAQARYWDVIFPSFTIHYSRVSNAGLGISGSNYVAFRKIGKKEFGLELYNQNNFHLNYGRKGEKDFFGLSVSNNFILYPYKWLDFGSLIIGNELSYFPKANSGFKEHYFLFSPSLGYNFFFANVSVGYGISFGKTRNFESYTSGLTLKLSIHPGDVFLLWD